MFDLGFSFCIPYLYFAISYCFSILLAVNFFVSIYSPPSFPLSFFSSFPPPVSSSFSLLLVLSSPTSHLISFSSLPSQSLSSLSSTLVCTPLRSLQSPSSPCSFFPPLSLFPSHPCVTAEEQSAGCSFVLDLTMWLPGSYSGTWFRQAPWNGPATPCSMAETQERAISSHPLLPVSVSVCVSE